GRRCSARSAVAPGAGATVRHGWNAWSRPRGGVFRAGSSGPADGLGWRLPASACILKEDRRRARQPVRPHRRPCPDAGAVAYPISRIHALVSAALPAGMEAVHGVLMQSDYGAGHRSTTTPVVSLLLVLNGLAFIGQFVAGEWLLYQFALWPLGAPDYAGSLLGLIRVPDFQPWQLVSYAFLHGGLLHLFTNMFAMWMFGIPIERLWGSGRFAIYY